MLRRPIEKEEENKTPKEMRLMSLNPNEYITAVEDVG